MAQLGLRLPGSRCDEGDTIDPYQVLGVTRDAPADEIRAAYRRLARQHHPDMDPSPDAARRFRAINDAYRTVLQTAGYRQAAGPAADQPADPAPDHAPGHAGRTAEPAADRAAGQVTEPVPAPPPPATNRLAAAAAVVSIAAICAPGPLLVCGGFLGPVGALLGHLARAQIRRGGGAGAGLAFVGIVVGWALTVVALAGVAIGVLTART